MPLLYVILSKVVPCSLPSHFVLFLSPTQAHKFASTIFWKNSQKELALEREILYNIQSL